MFHSLLRPLAVVCCLFLAACAGHAGKEASPEMATVQAKMGYFTVISVATQPETGLVLPALLYKNQDVSPITDPMRSLSASPEVQDFPLPGCESVTVEMFTGGANCCFGYYLLTSCPDGSSAAYIEPRNGGLDNAQHALRAYPLDDPTFFYYEPKSQKSVNKLSLSRVESPRITRFLVFENNAWRADKPGELPAAYTSLLAQTRKDKDVNRTAKAISMTYYTLMIGGNDAAAARVLKRSLPGTYAPLASVILADIKAAVAEFDPVRNLDISK